MAWDLPDQRYELFRRNTITLVVAQLRFHPILLIDKESKIEQFQDLVRATFPQYERNDVRNFEFSPGGVKVLEQRVHRFLTQEGDKVIALARGSLSLETKEHTSRRDFLEALDVAIGALGTTYSPISTIRLGLRYVNTVSKDRVEGDLKRQVEWGDLVHQDFTQTPRSLASIGGAMTSQNQITGPVSGKNGEMTVRFGFARQTGAELAFRLDTDRYLLGFVDVRNARDELDGFANDIYCVFRQVAGPRLLEWMQPLPEGE